LRRSRKHWGYKAAAALLCCLALPGRAELPAPSLCQPGEAIVFACSVAGKLVSLCRAADAANLSALQYRYGTPGAVELDYPAPGQRARAAFGTRKEALIGGGIAAVVFVRSGYTYTVYSRVSRADGVTPAFEDGVTVERRGKLLQHLRCDDGGAGFVGMSSAASRSEK